jgi:hypothetical protein
MRKPGFKRCFQTQLVPLHHVVKMIVRIAPVNAMILVGLNKL